MNLLQIKWTNVWHVNELILAFKQRKLIHQIVNPFCLCNTGKNKKPCNKSAEPIHMALIKLVSCQACSNNWSICLCATGDSIFGFDATDAAKSFECCICTSNLIKHPIGCHFGEPWSGIYTLKRRDNETYSWVKEHSVSSQSCGQNYWRLSRWFFRIFNFW